MWRKPLCVMRGQASLAELPEERVWTGEVIRSRANKAGLECWF